MYSISLTHIARKALALLACTGANQAPTLDPIGNKLVIVGNALTFGVTASDTDGPGPLTVSRSGAGRHPAAAGCTADAAGDRLAHSG